MRKITNDAIDALLEMSPFKRGNTEVKIERCYHHGFKAILFLHGNKIAINEQGKAIRISNSGYFTAVTKERLNGLFNVDIVQRRGDWYLNGVEWDGKWIELPPRFHPGTPKFNFTCSHCGEDLRTLGITERSQSVEVCEKYSLDDNGCRTLIDTDYEGIDWEWECNSCGGRLTEKQREDFGH